MEIKSKLIQKIIETQEHHFPYPFDCSVKENSLSIFRHKKNIYTYLNPVSYLSALNNKELFCKFDGILVDGSLLVWAIKFVYGKKIKRRSFDMTSMAPLLFEYASENNKSIYIVASKQEEIEIAVQIFKSRYPNLKIIGYRNGYFSSDEEKNNEATHIIKLNPDFIIVGMGIVKQEEFLLKVKDMGYKGIGFTCGGFIHQTSTNKIEYYPLWIDKLNLRFVYRMIKEKHTRKRYFKAMFLFPIMFIYERFFNVEH